jgi:hypothetical protein
MTKYICTMTIGGDIYYATLIANTDQEARDMAMAETAKQGFTGRARSWSVRVLEAEVSGPAQILDCGQREA